MALLLLLYIPIFFGWAIAKGQWIIDEQSRYSLYYTALERQYIDEYKVYFENGRKTVENFFQSPFKNDFSIYIHPSRSSLDSSWQKDWNMPDFKSQCWMVASGVAIKLDIISPKSWDSLACEHTYSNPVKTQRLITHELVHVYHGQQNKSPDFSNVNGIDWFVEGLAVYASGQCDTERVTEVKRAISEDKIPQGLDEFWSGKLRYGISGTMVLYIDNKYGREKIKELLPLNNITEVLGSLEISETALINDWTDYMMKL
ncbi:MAG: hypothetical protein JW731_12515 [Bacteroidales bacterium]|nr:hypothetical protein [Bacteroidales bacterium]